MWVKTVVSVAAHDDKKGPAVLSEQRALGVPVDGTMADLLSAHLNKIAALEFPTDVKNR